MKTRNGTLWLFIIPGLILYSFFFIIPAVSSLLLSLTNWDGMTYQFDWVGLKHYGDLARDPVFGKALGNNVKFSLTVIIFQFGLSLFFAILVMKNTKLNVVYRTIFFFPTVVSSVSIGFIWMFVYDPNIGSLNLLLNSLGLESLARSWLGEPSLAIYSIAFVQFWGHTGQVMIIFIAGLQSIPKDLYEVANIEGASRWNAFRYVTWPLLAPSATIVLAYTTIQSFKSFDLIIAMTDGGPNYASEILSTFMYHQAFTYFSFGYATAAAVVLMLIIMVVTYFQFRLLKADRVVY
ncbi:sugar ABC transporter permease [Paenibacillus pasadenensis]|uniref:carbohydrate ABC transporter permease n=1 Tax=Paenibacillus pasadenensis TaxID=217090 RepID=UPI00203C054B|nr:sugar ABC transporter permease [Paenibacillus pasadenensis]MCM3748757.1 sugar ABC transporter permease [Paenibacillus pasadenensis]